MCKCLPKQLVRTIGLASTVFYGVLSIICIFVQGYDYQQLDMPWTTQGPWRFTAILQVSSVVFVVAFFFVGLIVFAAGECKTIQIIYVVLGGMSALFSFAICAFTLTAGAIRKNELTMVCQRNHTGVFEYFTSLDNYFRLVDQALCTKDCPCFFSNKSALQEFEDDPQYGISFKSEGLTNDLIAGATHFGQCPTAIRTSILGSFISNMDNINNTGKLNQEKFDTYWRRIEKKFDCVGWCTTSYTKPTAATPSLMTKYLFSDVNRGVVRGGSCMQHLTKWLPRMLNTFGSVLLLISIGQAVSVVFALSLFTDKVQEGSNYPEMPHLINKPKQKKPAEEGDIGGNSAIPIKI